MIRTYKLNFLGLLLNAFLVLLIFSCSSAQDDADQAEEASSEPAIKQWLTMEGSADKPNIVLVSGDEEYRSEEALPQLAKILSEHHGFNCTVLFAQDPDYPGIVDPNYLHNIPGLETLEMADLMIIFTRFRALTDDQMEHIDDYLKTGKPVYGIRTSTHAFRFDNAEFDSQYAHYGNFYQSDDEWVDGFGRLVLGEKWISHHGDHGDQSTRGVPAMSEGHPILNGIEPGSIWGPTDVYGVRMPLPGDANPVLLGQVVERDATRDDGDPRLGMRPTDIQLPEPKSITDDSGNTSTMDQNDPMMPIAWTKSYQVPGGQSGKAFTTTIGASVDMLEEGTRRMMVNAAFWLLDLPVPEKANVDLVGSFEPTRFAFHDDEYWDAKELQIESLE